MARCSIARPMALSWSMDSQRPMISTPFSRNHISTSVSDWPSLSSLRHSHGPLAGGGLQETQPGPVPGSLAASVLEDLLAVGQHPARISKLFASAPIRGRSRIVFRSSFSGPRFWHGGVMLRRAEFWLCSHSSLYDNACQADGPDLSAM